MKCQEKKLKAEKGENAAEGAEVKEGEEEITLRPLNMEDVRQAKNQVSLCSYKFHESLFVYGALAYEYIVIQD